MKVAAVRPGHIFGPHSHLLHNRISDCQQHGPITVKGDALISASYVDNVAFALIQVAEGLEDAERTGVDGEVFNYVDAHVAVSTFDLESLLGYKTEDIRRIPQAVALCVAVVSEFGHFVSRRVLGRGQEGLSYGLTLLGLNFVNHDHTMSGQKFQSVFGKQPPYTFQDGIDRTRQWVQTVVAGL